ncbi:hypothetical protein NP493_561g01055, partial [Ridgeia piscesae]
QEARPPVTSVTWKKGQEVFSVTTDSKYTGGTVKTPSLTIGSVLKTDAGEYTCQLGNEVGHGTASVTLEVWSPAKLEFPHLVNIHRSPTFDDTDFNMTCTVSGSGDPMVEWQKNGESVDTDDFTVTKVQVTSGQYMYGQTEAKTNTLIWKVTKRVKYFTCNNITHFDGHYTCAVSTQTAGATTRDESKAFIVRVQYEARWSSGPTLTAAAPNDTSREIVCSVCANPQPTFLWTFKNQSLRKGIQVVGNKIILDHVTRDDFGAYQCMASNNINGQNRMAVFELSLVESGPARKPLGFTILSNHTSVTLTLQWRPGFDSGHPPQTFTLQYRASTEVTLRTWRDMFSHKTDGVTRYQATVTGLRPQTEYVFSLYAENSRPPAQGPNRSDTVSQTGSTTASPNIVINEVELTEDHMTVRWQYNEQSTRTKRSTSPSVSVVIYYQRDGGEEARYPPEGSVAAEKREVVIKGMFDVKATYKVWLKIYEGGLTVSFQQTKPLDTGVEIGRYALSFCSLPET